MILNLIIYNLNLLYDLIFYIKYFIYFNFFIAILINNIIYYKLFNKSNYYLIQTLYYSIKLNGCVLIKFVQWINNNSEMLNVKNKYIELFNKFYENNSIHSLNYTKKKFKNDFNYDFDEMIELDEKYKVKSGSIAQVYKGKFKKNNTFNNDFYNSNIAIKVIHPELKYQMFFPINFIYFYKYLVNNIRFLKKYDTIFNFESFFENLKLQMNMASEYKNMNYFYDYYYNNEYIVIPYPLHFSKNILIMQYTQAELFDDFDVSEFEKKKIITFFNLFLKDQYFFCDYFHLDLHDYNWRVNKYKDFYQLIIYDFGYIIKNDVQNFMKNFILYSDTNNFEGFSNLLYNSIINVNIEEKYFINNLKTYVKKFVPYTNDSIKQIYNFCYINNYKLKNNILEIFISSILMRKNYSKYLFKKNVDSFDYNFLIELNLSYVIACEKYNIFIKTNDYVKKNYLNNEKVKNNYKYENINYEELENKEESINI
mgnify:CR=1 FL=1